jgi:hypothetical protein
MDFFKLHQLPLKTLTIIHGAIGLFLCVLIWFSGVQLVKLGHSVRKIVGQDNLVFTNLTGLDLSMHSGWNSYAGVSQRQIYLAGWFNSMLRNNMNQLEILLANNDLVLRGELAPSQISFSRNYDQYYAVTSHDFFPVGFFEVYRNDKFSNSRYIYQ